LSWTDRHYPFAGFASSFPFVVVHRPTPAFREGLQLSEATVTSAGKAITDAVDRARVRLVGAMFETWDEHDVEELVRLMRKFADAVSGGFAR